MNSKGHKWAHNKGLINFLIISVHVLLSSATYWGVVWADRVSFRPEVILDLKSKGPILDFLDF